MEAYSTMGWIAWVVCVLLSAFSAAAQEAITPINQARLQRLEDEGMPRARAIDKLLEQSEQTAATLLLSNTLAIAGAVAAAGWLAIVAFGAQVWIGVGLGALTLVALALAQIIGKALAVRTPQSTARLMERPVSVVSMILSPFAQATKGITRRLLRTAGVRNGKPTAILNEEALYLLIAGGNTEQGEERGEHSMIHRIVELEDKSAREVMVPRIDIVAVEAETPAANVLDTVVEMGYSRVPVYDESIDNVVGIIYAKDLFRLVKENRLEVPARELMRPAYFIPESKHIDELLRELQQAKVHIAIVVDEYGGTAGLLTIEDLLEEIVGEIQDEYDAEEEERIQVLSDHEAVFDAAVSIDDVNRELGLELETDGYDTLGGLVYHVLGKMPEPGDQFPVEGLLVTVMTTEGRRIGKVKLELPPPPEGGEVAEEEGRRFWSRGEYPARHR